MTPEEVIEIINDISNVSILPAILGYFLSGLLIYQFIKYKFIDEIPILLLSFIFLSSGFLTQLTVENFDIIVTWANYSNNVISLPILTSVSLTFLANKVLQSLQKAQEEKEILFFLKSIVEEHLEKMGILDGVATRSVGKIDMVLEDLKNYQSFIKSENNEKLLQKISNYNSIFEYSIYENYNKQYTNIVYSVKKSLKYLKKFSQKNNSVWIYYPEDIVQMDQNSKRLMIDCINEFKVSYYIFMLWNLVILCLIETKYLNRNKAEIKKMIYDKHNQLIDSLISHFGVKEYYACEFIQYFNLINNLKKANFCLKKVNKISWNTLVTTNLNTPKKYISRLYIKRDTINIREEKIIKDFFSSIYFYNFIGFGGTEKESLNSSKMKFKKWLRDLDINDKEIEKYLSYMTYEFYEIPIL